VPCFEIRLLLRSGLEPSAGRVWKSQDQNSAVVVVGQASKVVVVVLVVDLDPLSSMGSDLCGRSRKFPLGNRPWATLSMEEHRGRASHRVCTLQGICSWMEVVVWLEGVAVLTFSTVSWAVEVGLVLSLASLGGEDVEVILLCSSDPGLGRWHFCQSRHRGERRIQ